MTAYQFPITCREPDTIYKHKKIRQESAGLLAFLVMLPYAEQLALPGFRHVQIVVRAMFATVAAAITALEQVMCRQYHFTLFIKIIVNPFFYLHDADRT